MLISKCSIQHFLKISIKGFRYMGHHYYQDRKLSKNINHVYQIIFIDDIDKANLKLYDRYERRNKEGKLEKYNLLTRIYVQMPISI